ncbi:MAG: hypothetical protein EXS24_03645 [Pedosphaera sp.]|nr:hypothetical protein [Pedosphaera sp.]
MKHGWLFVGIVAAASLAGCGKSAEIPKAKPRAVEMSRGITVSPLEFAKDGSVGFKQLKAEDIGLVPREKFSKGKAYEKELGNSGLAAGDVDGDGWCDLFVCGMEGPNALYRNLGGWKFEDITEKAGVACSGRKLAGAVFGDVDGDGDLDLIVTSHESSNSLFLNNGAGRFSEQKNFPWKKFPFGGSITPALADIDGDGDLDLFVTGFRNKMPQEALSPEVARKMREDGLAQVIAGTEPSPEFKQHYTTKWVVQNGATNLTYAFKGTPSVLYMNEGEGRFKAATDADFRFQDEDGQPMTMPFDFSHEAVFRDVDRDGDPDLYVCNDFAAPDRFWINDGTGRFRLAPQLSQRRTSQFSMGVDFGDINRDGLPDFIVVDMLSRSHTRRKMQMGQMAPTPVIIGQVEHRPQIMQNTLFLNQGDGTYSEIAQYAGVKASEWSWASVFLDVDLDGYEDILITTGMNRDYMDSDTNKRLKGEPGAKTSEELVLQRLLYPKLPTQNIIYKNLGNLRFEDVSTSWGFTHEAVSGGLAMADFDRDGDLDVIINNYDEPVEVYRNVASAPRLAVQLVGKAPNTQAIGTQIRVHGGPMTQTAEVHCGGGYASGSDTLTVFAAGRSQKLRIEVHWHGGKKTIIDDAKPNQLYLINESSSKFTERIEKPAPVEPFFVDYSSRLNNVHSEVIFDDIIQHQTLLPNRLSQLGPAVAWADMNQDGKEDLIVGTGRGAGVSIYYSDGRGSFRNQTSPAVTQDTAGIVGWTRVAGETALLIGHSNYEDKSTNSPSATVFMRGAEGKFGPVQNLPGTLSTTGPMAIADVDGDGDLDVFIGGRVNPGRYPEPPQSRLYLNQSGKLELAQANVALFSKLGMVSGAAFGDLDGDGDADLILAVEWGPVRFLRNNKGLFTDATVEFGLGEHLGWWNGVALGDLDNDGRLDIIASNWGRNSKYEHAYSPGKPLAMYYSDFDDNGVLDIVETHFDKLMKQWVPERGRSCSSASMPFLAQRNPDYATFGKRSLDEIYGTCLTKGTKLEASTLEHTLFLNTGGKFKPVPLPWQSQLAPAFGVNVADFDGDGREDLFISQNFFSSQIETPRSDGGRSMWLQGDGKGGLTPVPAQISGVAVYGEQRGAAVCDYNGDGRVDLVVSQNGAATKLFENKQAKPGLRIRLDAGPLNPTGIGAIVRLQYAEGDGPARLVSAGSGYWSQDSAVQVMGGLSPAKYVQVFWPGGRSTISTVPKAVREIVIRSTGDVVTVE